MHYVNHLEINSDYLRSIIVDMINKESKYFKNTYDINNIEVINYIIDVEKEINLLLINLNNKTNVYLEKFYPRKLNSFKEEFIIEYLNEFNFIDYVDNCDNITRSIYE